jgi:phage terminase large subunit-like protein
LEEAGEVNIDRWQVVRFPAIAEEDEKFRKKGEALWSEKFPIEKLLTIKNSIGITDFEALYQQNPLSSETAAFKQEYFSYYSEEQLPPQMTIDITVDPAISKKKEACNTAIVAVGKAHTNINWFVLDYVFGKFNPGELMENTFKMFKELKTLYGDASIRVWIEGVAYQESLEYFFREKMKQEEIYFIVNTFVDRHDKEQRIKGLEPLYRVGIIKHRHWMKDLESELVKFPVGKTVDIIDALSFHLVIKQNTGNQPEQRVKTLLERTAERQNRMSGDYITDSFLL